MEENRIGFLGNLCINKEIVSKKRERSSDARDTDFFRLLFVNIKKLALESILEMEAMGPHIKPILLCVDRTRILKI